MYIWREAPGRQLLNLLESSAEAEKVWGLSDKRIPVCCRLGNYGLSAHADRFENPRKELKVASIPSLEKGLTSGVIDLEELWAHMKLYERGRGLTAEELLYILSGRRDYDEQELQDFRNTLLEETDFKPDEKRLFLYHPITEDELQSLKEPQVMEVNVMLSLADSFFPKNTGLFRKGARFEQKIALFSFNFPSVEVPGCGGRIREFEERTGCKVEINKQCNISAIKPLLRSLLKEEKSLLKNVSFYNLQNVVRTNFSTEPISGESLIRAFKGKTGLDLCLEYPGKAPEEGEVLLQDGRQRMEQNGALSLIENVFKE